METWTNGLPSMPNHVSKISGHLVKVEGHFRSTNLDYVVASTSKTEFNFTEFLA